MPQGSILGPLLFLIYINDLCSCLKHECILFADDTTLVIKCENKYEIERETNNEIQKILEWLGKNKLQINAAKTKIVQYNTCKGKTTTCDLNIKVDNSKINIVNAAPFLGLTIDKELNWKENINIICTKLDKFVFALRKLRQTVSKETALIAYNGYVASLLRYGIVIWGNSVEVQRVFIAQKKCVRAVYGAEYLAHCRPIFKDLKILTLTGLYIYEICLFVRKNPHFFPLHDEILKKVNSRNPTKLYTPRHRLHLYSRNAYCMAITLYNKLPAQLKTLSFNKFRKNLYSWLVDKCFYTVKEYLSHR